MPCNNCNAPRERLRPALHLAPRSPVDRRCSGRFRLFDARSHERPALQGVQRVGEIAGLVAQDGLRRRAGDAASEDGQLAQAASGSGPTSAVIWRRVRCRHVVQGFLAFRPQFLQFGHDIFNPRFRSSLIAHSIRRGWLRQAAAIRSAWGPHPRVRRRRWPCHADPGGGVQGQAAGGIVADQGDLGSPSSQRRRLVSRTLRPGVDQGVYQLDVIRPARDRHPFGVVQHDQALVPAAMLSTSAGSTVASRSKWRRQQLVNRVRADTSSMRSQIAPPTSGLCRAISAASRDLPRARHSRKSQWAPDAGGPARRRCLPRGPGSDWVSLAGDRAGDTPHRTCARGRPLRRDRADDRGDQPGQARIPLSEEVDALDGAQPQGRILRRHRRQMAATTASSIGDPAIRFHLASSLGEAASEWATGRAARRRRC